MRLQFIVDYGTVIVEWINLPKTAGAVHFNSKCGKSIMTHVLDDIAKKYKTDKCSGVHNYCVKYEKYLPFKRDDKLTLLEIGVRDGQSHNMWQEYFFNSRIVGIDIVPDCKKFEQGNIFIEIGSQADEAFLRRVIDKYGPFDLVMDDGSHLQSHMVKSFEVLFPSVKNGGVYIVEDACCAYWPEFEGGYRKPDTVIEYFKNLVDDVNFRGEKLEGHPVWYSRREDLLTQQAIKKQMNIRTDIESINFMNSIILINKR